MEQHLLNNVVSKNIAHERVLVLSRVKKTLFVAANLREQGARMFIVGLEQDLDPVGERLVAAGITHPAQHSHQGAGRVLRH